MTTTNYNKVLNSSLAETNTGSKTVGKFLALCLLSMPLMTACQSQDIRNFRHQGQTADLEKNAATAPQSTVHINLSQPTEGLGLRQVDFSEVAGHVSCNGMTANFTGSPITITPDLINAGGCSLSIDSFAVDTLTYQISEKDPTAENLWSENSRHRFIAEDKELHLLVLATIPATLVEGGTYQFSGDLIGSTRQSISSNQVEATNDLGVEAALSLSEAPALVLQGASQTDSLTVSLDCSTNFNLAEGTCNGKSLYDELLLMFTLDDIGFDALDLASLSYYQYWGYTATDLNLGGWDYGNGERLTYAFQSVEGEIVAHLITARVEMTESGIAIVISGLPASASLQVVAQHFDPSGVENDLQSPAILEILRPSNDNADGTEGTDEIFGLPNPDLDAGMLAN